MDTILTWCSSSLSIFIHSLLLFPAHLSDLWILELPKASGPVIELLFFLPFNLQGLHSDLWFKYSLPAEDFLKYFSISDSHYTPDMHVPLYSASPIGYLPDIPHWTCPELRYFLGPTAKISFLQSLFFFFIISVHGTSVLLVTPSTVFKNIFHVPLSLMPLMWLVLPLKYNLSI